MPLSNEPSETARLRNQLDRLQVDFDNLRNRLEREKRQAADRAQRELILALLPAYDSFEQALVQAPKNPEILAYIQGMAAIARQFRGVFERLGVKRMDSLGKPFDPNIHEAVGAVEPDLHNPEGVVRQVIQEGYWWGDTPLRPAKVVVTRSGGSPRLEVSV